MKNKIIIVILFSVIASTFTYFIISDIINAIFIFLFTFVYSLIIVKKANIDDLKYEQLDKIYLLTCLLNLQMYSAKNLSDGYLNIMNYLDLEYQNIAPEDLNSHLLTIAEQYQFHSIKMYAKSIQIYENEGGNFNKITHLPYQNVSDCKRYYTKLKAEKKAKLLDVMLLYGLWILVICFLKIAVNDYFSLMIENKIYKTCLFIILIIGFFSLQSCVLEYYKNKIRGI